MRYQITHRTIYEYTEPVTVSHNAASNRRRGRINVSPNLIFVFRRSLTE